MVFLSGVVIMPCLSCAVLCCSVLWGVVLRVVPGDWIEVLLVDYACVLRGVDCSMRYLQLQPHIHPRRTDTPSPTTANLS